MAYNRYPCSICGNSCSREPIGIETNRILDACKDRDCYEFVRVRLSRTGKDIVERTNAIRAKNAYIMWTKIYVNPVSFNCGFYSVVIRFFVKCEFEACVGGGRSQEFEGIAVLEKKVVLYGGEGDTIVFRSTNEEHHDFCDKTEPTCGVKNTPCAVVEVVPPVILGTHIKEKQHECMCCCCVCDIPKCVTSCVSGEFDYDDDNDDDRCDCGGKHKKYLTISLGLFSVIRLVRPMSYMIDAEEYCIPDKVCKSFEHNDPCSIFNTLPFPTNDFCIRKQQRRIPSKNDKKCGC